jgi:poly-gamma-glutamate capsule biosynthesis protein CapA/YwtB (metallophosphatase superfamily)
VVCAVAAGAGVLRVHGLDEAARKLEAVGCGDVHLVSMSPVSRELRRVEMIPLQMRRFQLKRATKRDARWLRDVLVREGRALGTTAELGEDDRLTLHSVRQIEQ